MSRSYRKPWVIDGYGSKHKKFMKNYANRVIRRMKDEIPSGGSYRKINEAWDISDYRWLEDSKPRYYFKNGEMVMMERTPLWKITRK